MPLTPEEITNAKLDLADLGAFMNADETISIPTRYGGIIPSLRKLLANITTGNTIGVKSEGALLGSLFARLNFKGSNVAVTAAGPADVDIEVLGAKVITPDNPLFGAARYDPAAPVDATVALQAFFDHAALAANARLYVYDWRGEWLISDTIYACYDGTEANVCRRFICGGLRVAPLVSLPGGVALPVALDIAANRSEWKNLGTVNPTGALYANAYADRRYEIGVRRRFCGASTFDGFRVDDAIYEGVFDDSRQVAFTANGINFPNANNIGMKTGFIWGRCCGSSELSGFPFAPVKTVSAKLDGGWNGVGAEFTAGETFDSSSPGDYANSSNQRTRLTLNNTTGLRARDMVWRRVELTPAIYGTIAADNGAKTLTWTAGDPTTFFNVGDLYPMFQAGPNAGIEFRIAGFSGTSNRVIALDKAPTTHAATADATYKQYSRAFFREISGVDDATHIRVFGWMPDRCNSDLHVASGGILRVEGQDSANGNYGTVIGFACGHSIWDCTLYSPTFGTVLMEYCETGTRQGGEHDAVHQGVSIQHGHAEACRGDVVGGSFNATGKISLESNFDFSKWVAIRALTTSNSQEPASVTFGSLLVEAGGQTFSADRYSSFDPSPYDTTYYGISNAPKLREIFLHDDSGTIVVSLDRPIAGIFPLHHWARLVWTDNDGGPPDGTLTLNLEATLAALGWTFANAGSGTTYTIVAPTTTVILHLQFLFGPKKVAITRLNGA